VKKAEEIIGKPIYWQIPNEPKVITEAQAHGVPLIQHAPKSKAQQAVQGLALALDGKKAATTNGKSRRWFWQTSS
jgi:pilus assembly protein CpaE